MTGTKSLLFPGHLLSIVCFFLLYFFSMLCCTREGRAAFLGGVCYLEDEEGWVDEGVYTIWHFGQF